MQSRKMVKILGLTVFLLLQACSVNSVSERDAAIASVNAGRLGEARIHLKNALREAPNDRELLMLQARVALETGEIELAKTILQQMQALDQYKVEATHLLARAYLLDGKPKMALETLGDQFMASGDTAAIAADAYYALGNPAEGKATLMRGLNAFPKSVDLLQVDANEALAVGDLPRTRADLGKILGLAPKKLQSLLLAGRVALVDGNHEQAKAFFGQALEMDPANQIAMLAQAAIAKDEGDLAGAEKWLDQAIKLPGSGSLAAICFKAQLALQVGKPDVAEQLLQKVPDDVQVPYVVMLRGLVAAARGQNEQAISYLQQFFGQGNQNAAARFAYAHALAAVGDKAKAWSVLKPLADAANANSEILQFAVQLTGEINAPGKEVYVSRHEASKIADPNSKDMVAANKAIAVGDWAAADAIYSKLLSDPRNASNILLLNNAANVKLNLGKANDAVVLARRAAALAPNDPYVLDTLGWCIFKQSGPTDEAVALIRRAVAAMPGDPQIRDHAIQVGSALAARRR